MYLMYLRKSRQDDPRETVEEVLAKHETMLQEFALREFGHTIPEECIYREVVSGESIQDRIEIKKVLARIESPNVEGVVVIEPSRLSRGDLTDCGKLISDFRYTHTLIVTPVMTYNLENKMERKFFQDELLRGSDYLEYTKDILFRGRVAAVKRGCFVGSVAPFGFNRIKKGRDWTLEPNDDADLVKLIFEWYVNEDMSVKAITRRLRELGYKPAKGKEWSRDSVRAILANVHYIGKVCWNKKRSTVIIEEGERIKRRLPQATEDVIIAEGKHDAIVDPKLFEAAQTKRRNTPRIKSNKELINALAGILRCKKCGRVMAYQNKGPNSRPRLRCGTRPYCYKSAVFEDVVEGVYFALKEAELPRLQAKLKNGDGDAAAIQKKRIAQLVKKLEEYRSQEDTQYELLETKKYTQEVFDRRNAKLREKIEECEKQLHLARTNLPKHIDYQEKIVQLEEAIEAMRDESLSAVEVNKILKVIIDRIEYSAVDRGFNKTEVHLDVFLRL